MRTWLFICAALLAAASDPRASQDKKKSDTDKQVITVTGCVDGSWLHVQKMDPIGSYTTRYKLRGSKPLLKELASTYKGHLLEVTGAVTDTRNTTHRGKTVQVGKKTRIHTGAKEVPVMPSGDDPSLEVASYLDLKNTCR
jgi:flagellar hook-associated protein FlgK